MPCSAPQTHLISHPHWPTGLCNSCWLGGSFSTPCLTNSHWLIRPQLRCHFFQEDFLDSLQPGNFLFIPIIPHISPHPSAYQTALSLSMYSSVNATTVAFSMTMPQRQCPLLNTLRMPSEWMNVKDTLQVPKDAHCATGIHFSGNLATLKAHSSKKRSPTYDRHWGHRDRTEKVFALETLTLMGVTIRDTIVRTDCIDTKLK